MMTLPRIAIVLLCLTAGDARATAPDARVIFGASANALAPPASSPATIEEVSALRTLDVGGISVVVYPLDSNHAAEMLVSYAPASRTDFQGDLFYLPEAGATPATFEGGEELSRLP